MIRLGLTGGIGCGKSTVSSYLKSHGYHIIDADKISRKIYDYKDVVEVVRDKFPEAFEGEDLNRRRLAEVVFSDHSRLDVLNSITRKKMIEIIEYEMNQHDDKVVLDWALLFEAEVENMVDSVIVVCCSRDVQIQRVKNRDNRPIEEIESIIDRQMSQDERIKKADYIIDNSGDMESLKAKLDDMIRSIEIGG